MRLQMEMAEKLADGFSPHAAFEAKHKQSGHDQADEPVSACLGFPQRRLRIAVAAVHRLEVTMHTAFGKSGVLRKASDALLPVFTNRVENDQALGPQSHSGGPCSEGWLTWCLKSALQSTRSTTHCPALETWPIETLCTVGRKASESCTDFLTGTHRCSDAASVAVDDEVWHGNGCQNPDDGHDNHYLDECKTCLTFVGLVELHQQCIFPACAV